MNHNKLPFSWPLTQMFGKEAAKIIDYVECYPDGIGKGRKIAFECILAGVEGFPTWIINGQVWAYFTNCFFLSICT